MNEDDDKIKGVQTFINDCYEMESENEDVFIPEDWISEQSEAW